MNDISAILAKIQEDARKDADTAAAAAKDKADAITENYRQEAKAETDRILEAAKAQADAIHQRAASQAGIESRNQRLRVRREAINTAFEKAMEKLTSMPDLKKAEVYASMAAKALTGDAALVLNKADKAALGSTLPGEITKRCAAAGKTCKVTLSEKTGKFSGGFILDQGSTETNCTFEVLSASVKDELEAQVDAALFN